MFKKNIAFIIIGLVSLGLSVLAIMTAVKLKQEQPIAPTAPQSKPKAVEEVCRLSFTLTSNPTPTPLVGCDSSCTSTSNCSGSYTCYIPEGETTGNCRNSSCLTSSSCVCASPSPTPTTSPSPTPTLSPTPTPLVGCDSSCTSTSNCSGSYTCYIPEGETTGNCRNSSCLTSSSCVCASPSPTPTPVVTNPTSSPIIVCNSTCTTNSNCTDNMICYIPTGQTTGNCRNSSCVNETNCVCNAPTVPTTGTSLPTILLIAAGALLLFFGLAL